MSTGALPGSKRCRLSALHWEYGDPGIKGLNSPGLHHSWYQYIVKIARGTKIIFASKNWKKYGNAERYSLNTEDLLVHKCHDYVNRYCLFHGLPCFLSLLKQVNTWFAKIIDKILAYMIDNSIVFIKIEIKLTNILSAYTYSISPSVDWHMFLFYWRPCSRCLQRVSAYFRYCRYVLTCPLTHVFSSKDYDNS